MSRSTYKGLKIEHYADECNVPVPKVPERAPVVVPLPNPKGSIRSTKPHTNANLYMLLAEDGATDDESTESDVDRSDTSSDEQAIPGYTEKGARINWADSVAVA